MMCFVTGLHQQLQLGSPRSCCLSTRAQLPPFVRLSKLATTITWSTSKKSTTTHNNVQKKGMRKTTWNNINNSRPCKVFKPTTTGTAARCCQGARAHRSCCLLKQNADAGPSCCFCVCIRCKHVWSGASQKRYAGETKTRGVQAESLLVAPPHTSQGEPHCRRQHTTPAAAAATAVTANAHERATTKSQRAPNARYLTRTPLLRMLSISARSLP